MKLSAPLLCKELLDIEFRNEIFQIEPMRGDGEKFEDAFHAE